MFIEENWQWYVLRGILAIAFGGLALLWPGLTVHILIIIFGIYAVLEGILAIVVAFQERARRFWQLTLVEGIIGVGVGLVAFMWPTLTAIILLVFIAVWAVLTGMLELAAAIQLRKEIAGEWFLGLAGVLSILIGLLLIASPGAGILAIVLLVGIYAILFGLLLIFLGFKFRNV